MAIKTITLLDGTTAYAHDVEDLVNPLYTDIDDSNIKLGANIQVKKLEPSTNAGDILIGNASKVPTWVAVTGDATIDSTGKIVLKEGLLNGTVPIGTIIPFYDFNGLLTFDDSIWAYCNGQTKTFPVIGAQTLPDLSNRYLVGFGTENGGNIGSAEWSTTVQGIASHQINIQHSHTTNIAHGHGNTITATVPAHYHGAGNFNPGSISSSTGTGTAHKHYLRGNLSGGPSGPPFGLMCDGQDVEIDNLLYGGRDLSGALDDESLHTHSISATLPSLTYVGNSGGSNGDSNMSCTMGGGVTSLDTTSVNSSNSLSTAQSIQPRSIMVRFIMRYA